MNTTIVSKIVKGYLERFPGTAHRTLARKVYKENPECFTDIEHARAIIRWHTGNGGIKNREQLMDRRFVRDTPVVAAHNPYDLPQSDALEYPIFKFPKAQNRIAYLCDAHVPYHDVAAITAAMEWIREHEINTFFLSEWMDCHHLSSFVRDPRKRRFKEEREVLWRMLDVLQNEFPTAVFYYHEGNHEIRYERYMMTHAPEVYDCEEFRFPVLMRFGERGIIYIGDKTRVRAGKLFFLHGHEFQAGIQSPVNPARGLFLKTKHSAICGHYHQTSEHSEPRIDDDIITCWSVGCLCDLHPTDYATVNKWNHGFARIRTNEDESFEVTNLRIYKGKML